MTASSTDPRPVAAFDFDGTLSRRDTLVPFLAKVGGRRRLATVAAQVGLLGVRGRVPRSDRDALKAELLRRLFAGHSEGELRAQGELYARDLLSDELRPDVLQRLEQHLEADHETLFVSASLAYYLEPLAQALGVGDVIAVELAVDGGVLTGELAHPNVRAEQKAVRLREQLDQPATSPLDGVELWAYGNSSGDHALLELADHRYWLGSPKKLPSGAQVFVPRHEPFTTR